VPGPDARSGGECPQRACGAFLKETREWYARWARSPTASRFTEVDWDRLRYVVAPLFDRFLRSTSKELAGELRLQESLLGATLMDRQRMGLRVDDAKPAAQPPNDDLRADMTNSSRSGWPDVAAKRMSAAAHAVAELVRRRRRLPHAEAVRLAGSKAVLIARARGLVRLVSGGHHAQLVAGGCSLFDPD